MKPAERSSRTTWTRIRGSASRASRNGVDREPGATTASVTPARAHSSTTAEQNAACTSAGGSLTHARIIPVLHAERVGRGAPVVLVHGFTQSAVVGSQSDGLSRAHEVIAIDAPGHGRLGGVDADLPGGADLMAESSARRPPRGSGIRWAAASPCTSLCAPRGGQPAGAGERHCRYRRPRRTGGPARTPTSSWRPGSRPRVWRRL